MSCGVRASKQQSKNSEVPIFVSGLKLDLSSSYNNFCFLVCPPTILLAHSWKLKVNLQALSMKQQGRKVTEVVPKRNINRCGCFRSTSQLWPHVCVCVCQYTLAHLRAQLCNPRKPRSQFVLSLKDSPDCTCSADSISHGTGQGLDPNKK